MIDCKKITIILLCAAMLPVIAWAEAPVVDDSENFAFQEQPQGHSSSGKYDVPQEERPSLELAKRDSFYTDNAQDDGPALAKEDYSSEKAPPIDSSNAIKDNAKLLDKLHSLEESVQNLRGQLEVQAHDLKLLQQQQLAFYKDLDARLGTTSNPALSKAPMDIKKDSKPAAIAVGEPFSKSPPAANSTKVVGAVTAQGKANPADEQISYFAAYELVKNKRNEEAIQAMQTFVDKYPNGGYTANAEYWLGQLYLLKKDYKQACNHFEVVIHQFPSSSKAADSLFKDGYSLAALGYKDEAAKRFREVVTNYPGTPTANLAAARLKSSNAL